MARQQTNPKLTRSSAGRKTKSYEAILRQWGDVDVVDAEQNLSLFTRPEDLLAATKKDPGACVFAQACKRQFAATKVQFWRRIAFVELPGPNGKPRVERFSMPANMRRLVENFDRGKSIEAFGRFELRKPQPSETYAAKSRRNKAQGARRRAAILNGTLPPVRGMQGKGAFSKPAISIDLEVRDGRGQVKLRKANQSRNGGKP